ncbi:MAG: M48 family metallopeptidase [Comamonadaceae bacterium]|nr:MAG: M48 family metallopeptidase [Comamonadaceae bacterium]
MRSDTPAESADSAASNAAGAAAGDLVPARWYDGRSSQPKAALIGFTCTPKGPSLVLHPLQPSGAAPLTYGYQQVGWPETWHAQRLQQRLVVDLQDGGSLEVDDAPRWHAALQAAGQRPGLAHRMQTRWPAFIAVLAVAAVGLTLFYRYGTPWAATQLTRFVPLAWETALTSDTLARMDDGYLKPSKLPPERQAELRQRFDALVVQTPPALQRYGGYAPRYTLSFRSGMKANAFALPGGAIVVTDDLVQEARERKLSDDAIVGVLAHEIGHVAHRHTTRLLVEQGVLNIGLGLALGDVSGMLSTGSALLTGLAYRRNHEREADCFAIALMGHAKLPTAPMADLLLAIAHEEEADEEAEQAQEAEKKEHAAGAARPAASVASAASAAPAASAPASAASAPARASQARKPGGGWSLLHSHPDTVRRAEELRAGHAPHCAR